MKASKQLGSVRGHLRRQQEKVNLNALLFPPEKVSLQSQKKAKSVLPCLTKKGD